MKTRTIKIKLPFASEVDQQTRAEKLYEWAKGMLKGANLVVLEEKHLERMSYIVFENTKTPRS